MKTGTDVLGFPYWIFFYSDQWANFVEVLEAL